MINLVEKAQKGDAQAFLSLFEHYEDDIYRMAYVFVKNSNDALDAVQETAYRSFKNINTLKNPQYFKTWLTKIAMRCATDILRKNKKVIYLQPKDTELFSVTDQDIPLILSLQELLETLDDYERSILFLKFYDDYTFQEIAEIVEAPLGTVKSVCYRALTKLRKEARRANYE